MSAYRILHPRPALLLVSKAENIVNVMTLAWHTPVEEDKVAVAVDRENYSYELIAKSKEFTLNVVDNIDVVWKAGTLSGRDVNKIEKLNISLEKGVKIKTPHIRGAMAFLECKVFDEIKLDEHSLFLADIVHFWANRRYFKDLWIEGAKVIMHVGKRFFTTPSRYIAVKPPSNP